jgi:hypothetical protein
MSSENDAADVVVRDLQSPDQAEYQGHEGLRQWIEDWSTAWDGWQIELESWTPVTQSWR